MYFAIGGRRVQSGVYRVTYTGTESTAPVTTRAQVTPAPGFIEVDVTPSSAPVELLIELGVHGRMRLTSANQIDLAARLLHRLNAPNAC